MPDPDPNDSGPLPPGGTTDDDGMPAAAGPRATPHARRSLTTWAWAIALALCASAAASIAWRAPTATSPRPGGMPMDAAPPAPHPLSVGRFHGGPPRNGRSPYRGPSAQPTPERTQSVDLEAAVTGHALALEGAVFVATHGGWLHALSPAADGLVHRFRVPLGGHAQAGPVVGPTGHLWIGTDAGEVLRLDPQDGQIELRLQTDGPADTALAVHPDGFLLVAAGKRVLGLAPDGARRFSFSTRGKVFTTPAIDAAGNIYIAAQDHTLYSLDADGRLRFEREAGRFDLDAGPLIEPAGVWVGDDAGVLHAYDRDGRLRRHSAPLGGHLRAPLSLGAADTLLVHVFGPRSRLLGLDPADASVRFEYRFTPADGPAQGSRSGPLVDRDGRIYVGSHDGQLHALSPDGRRLFVVSTRARIDATPTLGPDGTLYFGSQDGRLYAVLR